MITALLSWWGIGLGAAGLLSIAVLVGLKFSLRAGMVIALLAAAHLYSGALYQWGVSEERSYWQAIVAKERLEREEAKTQALSLESQLALARAARDRAIRERQDSNEATIGQAPPAPGAVDCDAVCGDTVDDVKRLYDTLRQR